MTAHSQSRSSLATKTISPRINQTSDDGREMCGPLIRQGDREEARDREGEMNGSAGVLEQRRRLRINEMKE